MARIFILLIYVLSMSGSVVLADPETDRFMRTVFGEELPPPDQRYIEMIETLNKMQIRDGIKYPVTDPAVLDTLIRITMQEIMVAIQAGSYSYLDAVLWRATHLWLRTSDASEQVKKGLALNSYPEDSTLHLRDLVLLTTIHTDGKYKGLSKLFSEALKHKSKLLVIVYGLFEQDFFRKPEKLRRLFRMITDVDPLLLGPVISHVETVVFKDSAGVRHTGADLLRQALISELPSPGVTIAEHVHRMYADTPPRMVKRRTELLYLLEKLYKYSAPSNMLSDVVFNEDVMITADLLYGLMSKMIEIDDPLAIQGILGAATARGNKVEIREALNRRDGETGKTLLENLYDSHRATPRRFWQLRRAQLIAIAFLYERKASPGKVSWKELEIRKIQCARASQDAFVQLSLPFQQVN